jgi:hypothetical protein
MIHPPDLGISPAGENLSGRHYMTDKPRRLSDMAVITPGFSTPGAIQHQPDGRFQIIQPRHIDELGRPFAFDESLHAMRMDLPGRAMGYCIHPGEVLFMSRGERNRSAVIVSCPPNTVPTVAFFVLKPNPNVVLPAYLAWYLNQVPAQSAITQIRTGAGTPIVQRPQFEALPVLLPPLSTQRQVVHLSELLQREQDLMHQMASTVATRNRALGQTIISTLSTQ